MNLTYSEIILIIGFVISTIIISYLQGKIDKFKEWNKNVLSYNTYLFNSHQKIGELSLALVKNCEDLSLHNKKLIDTIKEMEKKYVNKE